MYNEYVNCFAAYDKQKKTLVWRNLQDLVTCGRGVDWTLVEINKALSLSAITTMLVSFLPQFERVSKDLLSTSMVMLWAHSVYSMYKFYGFQLSRLLHDKPIKKLSVALGMAGQVAISAGVLQYISPATTAVSATLLGIGHFWTMEVDYKWKLQVRPYAYLPFILAIPALASVFQ